MQAFWDKTQCHWVSNSRRLLNDQGNFIFKIKQSEKTTSWPASHPRKPEPSKVIRLSLLRSFESLASKPNEEICLDIMAKRNYTFFLSFHTNNSDYSATLEVLRKDTFGLNFFYLVTWTTGPL
jgi:hypothetical protein